MIKGFDISHWNGYGAIEKCTAEIPDLDFVFIKTTEGVSYEDPEFVHNMADANNLGLLRGCYHYARPERNRAIDEASWFCSKFEPYIGSAIPALDWEGEAFNVPLGEDWAYDWLLYVYEHIGVKPLIYTGRQFFNKCNKIVEGDFGLWIARWNNKTGSVSPWKNWAVWQYTNKPFDLDYFNGTKEQFVRYYGSTVEQEPIFPEVPETLEVDVQVTHGGYKWLGKTTLNLVTDKEEN